MANSSPFAILNHSLTILATPTESRSSNLGINLPALVGSDRQTAWATTIRAKRLASMLSLLSSHTTKENACLLISDAKWWIDSRDMSDVYLIQQAKAAPAQAA
jgi:hypothetical protein